MTHDISLVFILSKLPPLSSDTCYVLSFAVIMLNTSLHNPNVKDKPSVQRFTAMNRGINDGGDLPEDLLRVSSLIGRRSKMLASFQNKTMNSNKREKFDLLVQNKGSRRKA